MNILKKILNLVNINTYGFLLVIIFLLIFIYSILLIFDIKNINPFLYFEF
jgi:hypothetical protein